MDDNQIPPTTIHHRPSSSHGNAENPIQPLPIQSLGQWEEEEWPVAGPSCVLPQQSLLTSEPLDRAETTSSSLGKRRNRSASLPSSVPDQTSVKRRKHPSPSEAWCFRFKVSKREMSKLERAEVAAQSLRRELERVRATTVVASRIPPINTATLKTLEAGEILKNPQLRHDLLFDALAFRPAGGEENAGQAADMYWESLTEELLTGCRCVRWKVTGEEKKKETVCVCGGWRRGMTEAEWWGKQGRWPSRIPDMLKALREILVSLMGSTTPCPNHFAHSFSKEALEAHEATCPTVTHALVPELYQALDPEFITIQVRRGVFGVGIFEMLGEAMKVHCAPVRDAMVDGMVMTAKGDIGLALRKCFDCVEVMKLDIANHQVHALRPYLWRSAASHEMMAFQSLLALAKVTNDTSMTRAWIRDASLRVLQNSSPVERAERVTKREQLATRSAVEGFIYVVFKSWSQSWPPVTQKRSIQFTEMTMEQKAEVPECLRMDARRIKAFSAEVVELALVRMVGKFCGKNVKSDVHEALTSGLHSSIADLSMRLATRMAGAKSAIGGLSTEEILRVEGVTQVVEAFLKLNVRADSPVYLAALDELRRDIAATLTSMLLEKKEAEIRDVKALCEKMARIISFNVKVYGRMYQEQGMMVGL